MTNRFKLLAAIPSFLWLAGGCTLATDSATESVEQSAQDLNIKFESVWTTAPIHVCWEEAGNFAEQGWVRDQIEQTWETETAVVFDGWAHCDSNFNSGIRIHIADVGPNTAGLGTELDNLSNGMTLNFTFKNWSPSCASPESTRQFCIRAIAAHEFGHAMGFAHEQNRTDTPATCTQSPQGENGDTTVGSWDIQSVMNYCNPSWNNAGQLSPTDIAGATAWYGGGRPIASFAGSGNALHAFYRDAFDGSLAHTWLQGATLQGPESLGGIISSDPAAASRKGGVYDIVARGTDGRLWSKTDNLSTGGWSGWSSHGAPTGGLVGTPAIVSRGPDNLDVFARGADGALWTVAWDSTNAWHSWTSLGGNITGTPSAISWASNRLDVFARSADGSVAHALWNGGAWTLESLGASIYGSPAAVTSGAGIMHVFVRGLDEEVWRDSFDSSGWHGWTQLSGITTTGNPSAISWGPGRVDLFTRGTNGDLKHTWNTGTSTWAGWEDLGGSLWGGSPSVASLSSQRLEVLSPSPSPQHSLEFNWFGNIGGQFNWAGWQLYTPTPLNPMLPVHSAGSGFRVL